MGKCGGRIIGAGLFGALGSIVWPCAAPAQVSTSVQTRYELYAAGLHIADIQTSFALGSQSYRMRMTYHTTGIVSLFNHGSNDTDVVGIWRGTMALPQRVHAEGSWRGNQRLTDIDFINGTPVLRRLVPADSQERQPVPEALKNGDVDTLTAMADVMRKAAATGTCDLTLHTYDGHRVLRFESHTGGSEALGPYRNSEFYGTALRCDFAGTPVAGMKLDDEADARPFHGSIWLATPIAGAPLIPVRMSFGTRWFGDAIMYLIKAEPASDAVFAGAR